MTKYVTYSVPSTAKRINDFLSAESFTKITYSFRRPPEFPKERSNTNREALEHTLPKMVEFANREVEDDLASFRDKLGSAVTSYANVRDAIPLPETCDSLGQLLRSLDRVAKTGLCSLEDREIINNYEPVLHSFEIFVEAHQHQFFGAKAQYEQAAARLQEHDAGDEDPHTGRKTDRHRHTISVHQSDAQMAQLHIEEDESRLNLIQDLKSGIGHLAEFLNAECRAQQKLGRA